MKIDKDILRAIAIIGNIGFNTVINLLICVYLYKLYEKHFGFNSFVFIILMVLGVFITFYDIYNFIKRK